MRIGALILALLITPSLLGSTTVIPSNSPIGAPSIASDGSRTFVAWLEGNETESHVRGAISGVLEPFEIDGSRYFANVAVRYAAGQFLVTWRDSNKLWACRFTVTGARIDDQPLLIKPPSDDLFSAFAVTTTGWGFVFAWDRPNDGLYMRTLRYEGLLNPERRVLDTTGYVAARSDLSWNGSRFLYVGEYVPFSYFPTLGPWRTVAVLLDRDANPIGNDANLADSHGWTASEPRIATDGRDFLVVTSGRDVVYATTISDAGISEPRVIFRWHPDLYVNHDLVWDGQQYVVSVTYSLPLPDGSTASFVGAIHVASDGTSRMDVSRMDGTAFGSSISGTSIATLFVKSGNRSIEIHDIRDFTSAPPAPEAPQNVSVNSYPAVTVMRWDDVSSNEKGFIAGWYSQYKASVPANAEAASIETVVPDPSIYFVSAWNAGGFSPPAYATVTTPRQRGVRR